MSRPNLLRRLVPNSLFGRLVLILLGGLILAQLVTGYINLTERGQLLHEAGGMRLAQRIADIGRLLDSLPLSERPKIVAVFNAPPLVLSLDRPPIDPPADTSRNEIAQSMFGTMLRYALGEQMTVRVVRREGEPESFKRRGRFVPPQIPMMHEEFEEFRPRGRFSPPGMPMMPHRMGPYGMRGAGNFPPDGAFYTVQIALRDGTLATFDTFLSPEAAAMPMKFALTLLILLGTVVVLSLVAVRWVTGPLSSLAIAAERLGEDINRAPLPETGTIEAQRAARAFNTMQQRLSRFISERTRVLTAMSHDLKTPITRMRLRTEMLEDEDAQARFLRDLEEMESMVTQTIEFMRDTSASEPVQRVDIMALIESLQNDYRDTGRTVEIDGTVADPYPGRPLALRRCIANLVENAIRYGESAMIRVEDSGGSITMRILDEGRGIPEDQLERVFEPFYRCEESRNRETGGTGLGLGIARNIARAHGGDLVLRNREGRGLEAMLTLPRGSNT